MDPTQQIIQVSVERKKNTLNWLVAGNTFMKWSYSAVMDGDDKKLLRMI